MEVRPRSVTSSGESIEIVQPNGGFEPAPLQDLFVIPAANHAGHMRRLDDIEAQVIRMAIDHYDGHMSEVARRLGIGRSTLYRKLKEFGLENVGRDAELADEPAMQAAT